MEGSVSPKCNRLLSLLTDEAYVHVLPHLDFIRVPAGGVVHEAGQAVRHLLFPVSGLAGCVAMTADGKSTDLTLAGREGMLGQTLLLGGGTCGARSLVVSHMSGFRLPAAVALSAWRLHEDFQAVMLRYLLATMHEMIQVALCNKHHTVEQQLCRWLLIGSRRLGEPSMHVTQAFISQMLGVRREGITEAAGKLEANGGLNRERGGMTITDRNALQHRGCECCDVILSHHEEMLAGTTRDVLEVEGRPGPK